MVASSQSFWTRCTQVVRSRITVLRDRVRSRRARWATGGITRARHRPGGRSAASQAASLTSVWRPGPALTCGAWPHKTSPVPASRWHTGVPSSPVRSLATGVPPPPSSQSERPHRATGIVLKVRLSCPSGVTTHATTVFLCTSKPAQRSGMLGITTAAQRDHGEPGVPAWSDPDGRAHRPPWAVPAGIRVRRVDRRGGTLGSNDLRASRRAGVVPHVHAWW